MASEPSEEPTPLSLPAELAEWLDEQAADLGIDRQQLLVRLLETYRLVEDSQGSPPEMDIEEVIDEAVATRLEEFTEVVDDRVDRRTTALESEFDGKIEDVRGRVIQLKRELDGKAPKNHDHRAFQDLEHIGARLDSVQSTLSTVREEVGGDLEDHEQRFAALDERLDELESKLTTVARALVTLRSTVSETERHHERVDGIKQTAAANGFRRARCEHCGEMVDLALLTEPTCPHCGVAVRDVEPGAGLVQALAAVFDDTQSTTGLPKRPRLVGAHPLESGNETGDVAVIDGIGPTYAERLRAAGIETVADLAAADPERVAEATEASPARTEPWIDRAIDRLGRADRTRATDDR